MELFIGNAEPSIRAPLDFINVRRESIGNFLRNLKKLQEP